MSCDKACRQSVYVFLILLILFITCPTWAHVHHNLSVKLEPQTQTISGTDRIELSDVDRLGFQFKLDQRLLPSIDYSRFTLQRLNNESVATYKVTPLDKFQILKIQTDKTFTDLSTVEIKFFGTLNLMSGSDSGFINSSAANLFAGDAWYPLTEAPHTFKVEVTAPELWNVMAQGQKISVVRDGGNLTTQFEMLQDQEGINLIGGKFIKTEFDQNGFKTNYLLRADDPSVPKSFEPFIRKYTKHYSDTIAPYPYTQFSVIENIFETGYGFPEWTLLGPTVIRLPFIFTSSLPHEILHNWWGNSVYVNNNEGNWCEGLTTYLADHWQQEEAGTDVLYRKNSLIAYTDYSNNNPTSELTLNEFHGRHDGVTQAVGYQKSMMIFHMLKYKIGADSFEQTLKKMYLKYQFKKLSLSELVHFFETENQINLSKFYQDFVLKKGAPLLQLSSAVKSKTKTGTERVEFILSQGSADTEITIPVLWTLKNGKTNVQDVILKSPSQKFYFESHVPIVSIEIDPEYDVLRKILPENRAVTLSQFFSSSEVSLVFNAAEAAQKKFIDAWQTQLGIKFKIITLEQVEESSNPVLILGDTTAIRDYALLNLSGDLSFEPGKVTVKKTVFAAENLSWAFSFRSAAMKSVLWVNLNPAVDPTRTALRLTHYGSSENLVFDGSDVALKPSWELKNNSLKVTF